MARKIVGKVVAPLLFVAVAVTLSVVALKAVSTDEVRLARLAEMNAPKEEAWIISPYDKLFKEVGEQYGVDWILLSAIASAESRFNPNAVSKAGATGLMQVMPSVARGLGYTREDMLNERLCIEVGAKLLHLINDSFRFSQQFNKTERLNFILASYNAGYGRIADARRLARYHGASTGQWSVVAPYLKMLSQPDVVNLEVVKGGAFHGSAETIGYVRKVMRLYRHYKEKVEAATKEQTSK